MNATRSCSVPECDRVHCAGGYCRFHYNRMWRTGTTDAPKRKSAVERFHESYKAEPAPYGLPTPCWIWTKSVVQRYPQFKADGKQIKGHRFSYITFVGPLGEFELVRHRCDRPTCVNPDHLLSGSHWDNAQDRKERGRAGYRKLTDAQVAEIREKLAGGWSRVRLAEEYGVTEGMIGHIKKGRMRTKPTRSRDSESGADS